MGRFSGSTITRRALLVACLMSIAACGVDEEVELDEPRIFGGFVAAKHQWSFVVAIERNGDPHHCAGTHIAPGWVLTAAHCVDSLGTYRVIAGRHDLTTSDGWVVDVAQIISHAQYSHQTVANDIALLRLAQSIPVPTVQLASRYEANGLWDGELATVVGWGNDLNGSSSNKLRQAALEVLGVGQYCEDNSVYPDEVGENCPPGEPVCDPSFLRHVLPTMICLDGVGRGVCDGDSGGPALVRKGGKWVQIGITSWGSETSCAAAPGVFTLVSEYRDWIAQNMPGTASKHDFTPGDFDGVNGTDLVMARTSGSSWWLSDGDGTMDPDLSRMDLVWSRVEYTPGNFYGGNPNDLVISTSSGSYFYRWTGSNMSEVVARPNLPIGKVSFVPFDLEGNGWIDYAVTTPSGTEFWRSAGNGNFTIYGPRTDLRLGEVEFTPADFDYDTNTDLVITTEFGSYWHFSNGNGTFTERAARSDLPIGKVQYVVGDFDGQIGDDLVVTTAGGSYWYLSDGDGTFTQVSPRTDLPLGTVAYVPGDFNDDGLTDLVVTTSSGSYWYHANGDGTWWVPYVRSDLKLGQVRYTPGDWDDDDITDLVITTQSGTYWYLSNGDGTWQQTQSNTSIKL
jgi:secreted trypsin-like serine protease